ncbi:hypothetical protein AVEN_250176-1 [Araneus ventricosus]|uniref:Uncharacterized protein n=1 Tax=Araneus ventricosus TaxID=182803 RepID=A0A4Y2TTJ1_ARAVE|nr:hypothetical protein AVEN_250176-1 [Araneus ventricosus]
MVVRKFFMIRVEPFGRVAERFASQQETRFPVRFSVRFPPSFYYKLVSGFPQACFMPFQKVVKNPPSAKKKRIPFLPPKPYSYKEEPPLQRGTPTNFKFLPAGDRTRGSRVGRQTQ